MLSLKGLNNSFSGFFVIIVFNTHYISGNFSYINPSGLSLASIISTSINSVLFIFLSVLPMTTYYVFNENKSFFKCPSKYYSVMHGELNFGKYNNKFVSIKS